MVSPREAAEELAEKTGAQVVQVIGTRFILFRQKRRTLKYHWHNREKGGRGDMEVNKKRRGSLFMAGPLIRYTMAILPWQGI